MNIGRLATNVLAGVGAGALVLGATSSIFVYSFKYGFLSKCEQLEQQGKISDLTFSGPDFTVLNDPETPTRRGIAFSYSMTWDDKPKDP
jgi:hypothetical protein